MIKLCALIFMVIDHIGYMFCPQCVVLRVIGRLSMPLYAYCVARGFYHHEQRGTVMGYVANMLCFAAASQLPYIYFGTGLNIGVTWVLALLLLHIYTAPSHGYLHVIFCVIILAFAHSGIVNYGVYGVVCPILMYDTLIIRNRPEQALLGMAALCTLYVLLNARDGLIQVFAVLAVPLITALLRHDYKVRLHKRLFYIFYPTHIVLFLAVQYFIYGW